MAQQGFVREGWVQVINLLEHWRVRLAHHLRPHRVLLQTLHTQDGEGGVKNELRSRRIPW